MITLVKVLPSCHYTGLYNSLYLSIIFFNLLDLTLISNAEEQIDHKTSKAASSSYYYDEISSSKLL